MIKAIKISLICFTFLGVGSLAAQPMKTVDYNTKLQVADLAASEGDYYGAIEWYTKAFEESKDLNLQLAIADLYVLARDFNKAEKIYDRILKRDKKREYEDIRIDFAKVLKSQGKYREALSEYNTILGDAEATDSLKAIARFELKGIEMMDNLAPNLEAIVNYLPGKVNSGSAETSPAIGPEGSLYFSSFNRKKEIILDGSEKDYHAKLFTAEKNDKGEYDKITALPENINRTEFNTAGAAFSRDGKRMYFTRALLQNNNIESSTLFVSTRGDAGWSSPREITELKGDFIIKHPYVGELFGNEVLFFSSNMLGGLGGYDLFYSQIKGDSYGIATNLGNVVNTAADEVSPYYNNGTLYFSSNGHPNIGGFDIFYANWNGFNWEGLTNIGFNYNSAYDDLFFRFNESGSSGFLVSNRPNKDKQKMKGSDSCCDDIYGVYIRELVIDLLSTVEDQRGALNGANVEVYDLTLGGYPETKTNFNGNVFNFPLLADRNYKAIFKKEGYFPDTITFNTNGIVEDKTIKRTIKLKADPDYGKDEVEIVTINQAIRLNNIYYNYDKSDILPDAEEDLNTLLELMEDYPDMVIELSSHTDARGDDGYNQKLSQRRAESAKTWLIAKGVNKDRIKPVGYGEKVILNKCANNVRCTDAEHRINRRTEFKIIAGPQTIEIKKEIFKDKGGDRTGETAPRGKN
ncbi:MAG: OmpA family protein [Saprospiraceae bacterium]|nr:OmpA family protein [Saprospiraceae bacterium]MBK7220140.1 OmpA family protein [Saprospiraceae bacterium]MBK8849356.1 OmpA family protein [Saprospiraceae bacterium]